MSAPRTAAEARVASPVLVGVWFALMLGLAETAALAYMKLVKHAYLHYNVHQIWAASVSNVLLFAPAMLVLLLVARRRGRAAAYRWALALFAGATAYGVLLNLPRLHEWALLVLGLGVGVQAYRLADRFAPLIRRAMHLTIWPMGVAVVALFAWVMLSPGLRERRMTAALGEGPGGAPNVFLLILDTVRARSMSLYGYDRVTTPRIAAFAGEGVTFTRAISAAPWTLPGHTSMFTGRWPHELGIGWRKPYDGRFPLLAEVMAERGYRTAAFTANPVYLTTESGLQRGFAHFESNRLTPGTLVAGSALGRRLLKVQLLRRAMGWHDRPGRKTAADVKEELLHWLDEQPRDRPVFAFLNYYDAHNPYLPPAPYDSIYGVRGKPRNLELVQSDSMTQEEARVERDAYDASLAYLDAEVGALLDSLRARGALEHSIVIISSDHGEEFAEHGWLGHGNSLYLASLHVPLVIVGPGIAPAGTVVNQVVSTRDVAATVLALSGTAATGTALPGRTLARFWAPDAAAPSDTALAEVDFAPNVESFFPVSRGDMDAVLTADYHLIRDGRGDLDLFDLHTDSLELHDLAAHPALGPVVSQLDRHMRPQRALRGERVVAAADTTH